MKSKPPLFFFLPFFLFSWPLGENMKEGFGLLVVALFLVVAAAAAHPHTATPKAYLGDFSLDPDSDNRKTPAKAEDAASGVRKARQEQVEEDDKSESASALKPHHIRTTSLSPSYPACVTLCSSQKRAMRRQELAARKQANRARIVNLKGKGNNIAALEAKDKQIQARLKELRRKKRAAAHANRKLLMVENTDADDERASRLDEFAKTDSDPKEAKEIRRLLRERKKLLGYLVPDSLESKQVDNFQKRIDSLPFAVAGETDCVGECKQARLGVHTSIKRGVKPHKTTALPDFPATDKPMVYQVCITLRNCYAKYQSKG
jgi:hypothetical protein